MDAWRLSAGFVDCTLLSELLAAGYDRSFETIPPDRPAAASEARPLSLIGPGDIEVSGTTVRLPAGIGLDPGGIGKGLAADLVSAELIDGGAEGVCVNLGGDLRVRGRSPVADAWTVSLDHPDQHRPIALVGLHDGAVATSTDLLRRWSVGGEVRHHLIDPRTGRPAESDVALVSAVAGEAWMAEALAKAVLLRGGPHPWDLTDGSGAEALLVRRDGTVEASPDLGRFLGGVPVPACIGDAPTEVVR